MDTLYDLLGALPRDDADELRVAFRRAVKGAHPDLNPGDPDAGLKFMEIVRANEILSDEEQRAAYDHLLVLARKEQKQRATATVMHKAATSVIALVAAASLGASGYLLVLREPALADTFKHFATVATAQPADFAGLPRPAETVPRTLALMEAWAAAKANAASPQNAAAPTAPPVPPTAKQQIAANIPSDVIVPIVVTPIAITPVVAKPPADPENAMASVGQPLELTLENTGSSQHDFSLSNGVAQPIKIEAAGGQTAQGTVVIQKPGTYEFVCSQPGHSLAGMRGTIIAQ